MKIYIAGPWLRRLEVRRAAQQLEAAGHTITSRWLYKHEGAPGDFAGLWSPDDYILEQAIDDVNDVLTADVFVMLNLEKSEGKAFEMGVAYMAGIPIICVGERFNIFCTLGTTVETIPEVLNLLSQSPVPA